MESRVWGGLRPSWSEWRRGFSDANAGRGSAPPARQWVAARAALGDFGLRHALSLAAITGTLGSLGGYLVSEIVLEPFVSDEAPSGTFVVTAFLAFGPLSVTALARARAISAGAYSVVAAAGWSGAVVAAAVSGGLLHSIGVFAAAVALVAATTVQATVLVQSAKRRVGS